jgi:carboxyl-terminal processing protease
MPTSAADYSTPVIIDQEKPTQPPQNTGEGKADIYQLLDFFGGVLETVRTNYVDTPDDRALIKNAILGMEKLLPKMNERPFTIEALRKLEQPGVSLNNALDIFGLYLEQVRRTYPEVKDEKLISAAVEGLLTGLDTHSGYRNLAQLRAEQEGRCKGGGSVGLSLTMTDDTPRVVALIDNSPAVKVGLQPKDFITHVDSHQTKGQSLEQVIDLLCGPVGSTVTLTIAREKVEKPFNVSVGREVVHLGTVRVIAMGDVGYIRIPLFDIQTSAALQKGIEQLKAEIGPNLKGYVVDLRDNPGGLLDAAIAVTDAFLDHGTIMVTHGRKLENAQNTNANPGDIADGMFLVVLINHNSAAGAEIMAAALQDHKRAQIVGEHSNGAGTIQTVIPFGENGAIRLTTGRIFRPSGVALDSGIEPDTLIENAAGVSIGGAEDRQLSKATGLVMKPRCCREPLRHP